MDNSNSIILEEKLHSFSEEELTQYIYKNVDSLTTISFSALKKEIAIRKDLPNEVKMLIGNIQDLRNQNFINEIFPYLYSKNKKIKTVEDLIADLKKNEIYEPDINSLLRQLPKIIEINTAQSNPENSIKIFGLLFCIVIAIVSFNLFTTSSIIIFLIAIFTGLYIAFNRNDYSRINKLKINIEFYLESIKNIPKIKSEL
ncbi:MULTISPECIES: hypothetical protein [Flavobacterium]|uniref:Uncharacterized protein n=1 Tax=Flavobacterium gawalongense TaxID=2594432 RepID=A0A553BPI1_9FLAO|nr:hypothetical protein [Flavobacterium gawalongense]TRX01554.1 hypothetical protein FNW33_09175 [Flavobacterium gawalongense]TRX06095.1 hypothetical protein FNW12_09110 [Flavobacterium gawalongense]TRX10150.1 hypothetical protein FNW11_08325 [Flavobacterium gawalongense]TRX11163.1 hypothetical protein FNW10_08110 [Flavobacterium gawalongense]TRX28812.1 hypothetical protein FNW38_08205 [Flavobacterium gawalongense]